MNAKKRVKSAKARKTSYWPSHHRFSSLIDFSIRGKSHPNLKTCAVDDHIAQASELVAFDTDRFLWFGRKETEGKKVNEILHDLGNRVFRDHDLQAAEMLYAIATRAAFDVLSLYLRHRDLFDQIAPRRRVLPCFFSIHPGTAAVIQQMRKDARLGTRTRDAPLIGSKAYFVSDTAANVYARAIIHSIEMNRDLPSIESQQASWKEFDKKEGLRTVMLPFPKYINGIAAIPVPLRPDDVLQYWRKGKEMILEEMPCFHLRPEWERYREGRKYESGAKTGAVQHAIFKDILIALKTIAGINKTKPKEPETGGNVTS